MYPAIGRDGKMDMPHRKERTVFNIRITNVGFHGVNLEFRAMRVVRGEELWAEPRWHSDRVAIIDSAEVNKIGRQVCGIRQCECGSMGGLPITFVGKGEFAFDLPPDAEVVIVLPDGYNGASVECDAEPLETDGTLAKLRVTGTCLVRWCRMEDIGKEKKKCTSTESSATTMDPMP